VVYVVEIGTLVESLLFLSVVVHLLSLRDLHSYHPGLVIVRNHESYLLLHI
jgi:hypothetical protein